MKTTTTKRNRIEEVYVRYLDSWATPESAGTFSHKMKNGVVATSIKLAHIEASDRVKSDNRKLILAGILTEKNATPGLEAVLVGLGTNAHVNVFKVETVDAREQTRGICQVCGGLYAIEDGTVSLHGYKRPRWGFVVGRCAGSRYAPANVDVTITKATIAAETEHANRLTAELAALPALTNEQYSPTRRIAKDTKGRTFWTSDFDQEQGRRYSVESAIRNARSYVTFATATILPALGTPFTIVLK